MEKGAMKKYDFVREIVDIALHTGLSADRVNAFENTLRREYGGKRVVIERKAPITLDDVNHALREQKSVKTISKQTGLSRSTIYRMLSSRKSHRLVQ